MGYSIRLQFLFDKYLQRQCTSEEVEEMISLLQQADADEMLSEPMQELWNRLKSDQSAYDVDWDKMFTAVRDSEENISFSFSEKSNALRRTWYKIAAAAVILIGSAGAYLYFSNHANTNQQPVIANAKNIKNQQPENKRQTIYLPDGSTVILNAESKLNYPSSFSGKTREVFLSGEAYFDIKHNPQQPCMVHAGKITTKVLGTAFNVKAYPADESIEVTVTRGKVQVLKENTSLGLVTANQQISFSKKTEAYSQKKVDARLIVAWKPEEIIFNDIQATFEALAKYGNSSLSSPEQMLIEKLLLKITNKS